MAQLIRTLPGDSLPDLALFYHLLLSALPVLAPAAGSRADKEEPRFVNALVRGMLLALSSCSPEDPCQKKKKLPNPRRWGATCCRGCGAGWRPRWGCLRRRPCRLHAAGTLPPCSTAQPACCPRMLPRSASSAGTIVLSKMLAMLLSVLINRCSWTAYHCCVACRVYAQALLVLDDDDFYRAQTVFTLGQQRAVATALNTLVYRTHCPTPRPRPSAAAAPPYPGGQPR